MKTMSRMWRRARLSAVRLLTDCRAIAATEFAVIVPIMLVLFFGTVEFSSGVAVDRKVTLVSRTLSDLTSQSSVVAITDNYLQNVFTASIAILTPYLATPTNATISEIYVDSSRVAKIQWSKSATIGNGATQATLGPSGHNAGDVVTVPPSLLVRQTYLILSEVSYVYVPTIGYVMAKTGVTLSDFAYTRPRQFACLTYNNVPVLVAGACPTP
jgi:Flp pilus assembly protein TadG